MDQSMQSKEQVLILASELVSPIITQQQAYFQKLGHYQSIIQQSIALKHSLLLQLHSEQIKQNTFEVINNLIKENSFLQKRVTLLQEKLIDNVSELAEAKKLKTKFVRTEQQLKKIKEQNENIKELQETVKKIKDEIGLLASPQTSILDIKRIEDPYAALSRQRDQLIVLKKVLQLRLNQSETDWTIVNQLSDSLTKREQLHDQTVEVLTCLLEKSPFKSVQYRQTTRMLNFQQQQLIKNYQNTILSLKKQNQQLNQKNLLLQQQLRKKNQTHMKMVQQTERITLKTIQNQNKIDVLQNQIKRHIQIAENSIRQKQNGDQNNREFQEMLGVLKQHNDKIAQQLNLAKQQKQKMIDQIEKYRKDQERLQTIILSKQKQNEENKKNRQNNQGKISSMSLDSKNKQGIITNLQKQINLLNEKNKTTGDRSLLLERQNLSYISEIQMLRREIESLKVERQSFNEAIPITNEQTRQQSSDIESCQSRMVEENLNNLNEIIHLVTFQY